jgi:HEAT repeat protein
MTTSPDFGPAALPRSLDAALRDVTSRKVQVRRSATRDLGAHVASAARARVVQVLEELAEQDGDIEVRAQAVLAMADGGAHEAVGKIVQLAKVAAPRVRQMALLALGELANPDSLDAIDAALAATGSELPALRYQGLVTLRHLHGFGAVAVLASRLTDSDDEVRWVAIRLLDELSVEDANQPDTARPIDETIRQVSPALRSAMQDPNLRVATAARLLLARWGDTKAIEGLTAVLSDKSSGMDEQDELVAIRLTARWRVTEAKATLQKRAWPRFLEGPATFAARLALAQLGDERARQSILDDLHSASPAKCARAIEPVGSLGLVAGRARLKVLLENPQGKDVEAIRLALQRLGE